MASRRLVRRLRAPGWEDEATAAEYDRHLSLVTTQSLEALLDDAGVERGQKILDVAAGAGYVAAAAAQRGADPLGIDFSTTQVRLARARYPSIRFEQANAEALPFDPESFEAVVNAFGLCHLPNPDLALREAFRVLKPGGRFAFSVWDQPERVIGLGALYDAIHKHGSMDVGLPAGPNFFLFSSPEQSIKALLHAGFESPTFRTIPQVWRSSDPDKLFAMLATGTVLRLPRCERSSEARKLIRAAVRQTISTYQRDGQYEIPMPAVVAAAVKPLR